MKAKQFLHKIQIKNRQRAIKKQYEKEGLTDEVLTAQIKLNRKKNELDISTSEKLHGKYVQ